MKIARIDAIFNDKMLASRETKTYSWIDILMSFRECKKGIIYRIDKIIVFQAPFNPKREMGVSITKNQKFNQFYI